MPRDEEITYADHLGRFYARRYAFPPMAGRVLGYLLVCDPPNPTIAELSDALLASRSAPVIALDVLERLGQRHAAPRGRQPRQPARDGVVQRQLALCHDCLLYTSDAADEL